jgi:hypothetical protein
VHWLLVKGKEALERLHDNVFPNTDVLEMLKELVEVFAAEEDPLVGYTIDHTQIGAKTIGIPSMPHEIDADF